MWIGQRRRILQPWLRWVGLWRMVAGVPRPMPSLTSRQPLDRTVWHCEKDGGPAGSLA